MPQEGEWLRTAALALAAVLLLLAWAGLRRWRARRLTLEERQLLYHAGKSQGMLLRVESDRIPGGWLRAGGVDFNRSAESAALYRGALERLIVLGHVARRSADSYSLTHSGWRKA